MVGLAPRANPVSVVLNFVRARTNRITYGELSRRLNAGEVKSKATSYMGFAIKGGVPNRA